MVRGLLLEKTRYRTGCDGELCGGRHLGRISCVLGGGQSVVVVSVHVNVDEKGFVLGIESRKLAFVRIVSLHLS